MRAAGDFVAVLGAQSALLPVRRVQIDLYGSLALTGKGHGTDWAVILGLCGEVPDRVDPETIEPRLAVIRDVRSLPLRGVQPIAFDESHDLLFHKDQTLRGHSNGMRFRAFDDVGAELAQQVYYSIGGGLIVREGEPASARSVKVVPYPFASADELLHIGEERGMAIWQIALENEKSWHGEGEIREYV
jgi:L-serine dehydratase